MLKIKNVIKKFGSFVAVDDLTIHVHPGEWYLFTGPNGAGKTTTFRMIAGLLPLTGGSIEIMGLDVQKHTSEIKKIIGYLPEKAYLYDYLTGKEYLQFAGEMQGISSKELPQKIGAVLDLMSFERESRELIQGYSAGMRKKLGLCSVLLHDPPLLLLDEPTSDLDAGTSNLIRNLLKELTSRGKTVFMSTHIFGITENLCHRVGILNSGKLLYQGNRDALTAQFGEKTFEEIFLDLTGRHDQRRLDKYLNHNLE